MKLPASMIAAAALALPAAGAAQLPPTPAPETAPVGEEEAMLEALREAVASMRRHMFAPGPAVEGWDQGGADPDSELRAAGAERHFFRLSSDDGPSVVMLTRRPIADFAPAEWRIVDSYGSSRTELANPFVQFTSLTPRYVIGVRANSRRVASVDCSDAPENAILYEVPGAPGSADDEQIPFFFRIALLAGEGQVVCSRYEREAEGYRVRAFLPDGRSLPQLDDESERLTIVPAAPLDMLLRRP